MVLLQILKFFVILQILLQKYYKEYWELRDNKAVGKLKLIQELRTHIKRSLIRILSLLSRYTNEGIAL